MIFALGFLGFRAQETTKICSDLSNYELDTMLSKALDHRMAQKTRRNLDGATGEYSLVPATGQWRYFEAALVWNYPVQENSNGTSIDLMAHVGCDGTVEFSID